MNLVSVNIMGGLGNILFQIITAYAISIRDSKELIVDISSHHGSHRSIISYSKNILRNIKLSSNKLDIPVIGESGHHYQEIPKVEGDIKLNGYFQSEKYFQNYRESILEKISPTEDILNNLMLKYGNYLSSSSCSIHIRRGDYLGLPNHHPILPIDYYNLAIDIIGNENQFLIFSDDIEWCKKNFDFVKNKIFVEGLEDYEEIYLMSLCANNIIANSTFSWWGAWLNQNQNKKVISPSVWFGNHLSNLNTKDIYCNNWIII